MRRRQLSLLLAVTLATTVRASAPGLTEACLSGHADACEEAAAIADLDGHPAFAAHLREYAASHFPDVARVPRVLSAEEAAALRPVPPPRLVDAEAPETTLPAADAEDPARTLPVAGRVAIQASVGLLFLAGLTGGGYLLGSAFPCSGFLCSVDLVIPAALMGLLILPVVEYAVGHAIGGKGSLGGALLGGLLGIIAGAGIGVATGFASNSSGKWPFIIGGSVLGGLAVLLGPAIGSELSSPGPVVAFAPLSGGGAFVLTQQF